MPSKKLFFPGSAGATLAAYLELPADRPPVSFALFSHCFTCSKDYKAVVYISRALADRGIAVLRFDFTGLGESGGDFSETLFSSNVEDVIAAAGFLESQYRAPGLLVGHSLGADAAIVAARRLPSVRAVVALGAPFDPGAAGRFLRPARETAARFGAAELELAGRKVLLKSHFFEDLDAARIDEAVRGLGRPLLILHSPSDEVVDVSEAEELFRTARYPKGFVSLDGADHLLSDRELAIRAGSLIAAWGERFLT
jgi:putative redox protein